MRQGKRLGGEGNDWTGKTSKFLWLDAEVGSVGAKALGFDILAIINFPWL